MKHYEGKRVEVEVEIKVSSTDGYTSTSQIKAQQRRTVDMEPEAIEAAINELGKAATREAAEQAIDLPAARNQLSERREAERRAREERDEL